MARRKKNSLTAPSAPSLAQPKMPWYKHMWVVVLAVASVAFTLGLNGPTLLQNIRQLPSEVETTRDQYLSWLKEDAEWTGDWSTFPEGIVDMGDMQLSEGVDLKLSLQAKNGELGGTIATSAVCANMPVFDFLLLRGTVRGDTANVEAWDIVGGHQRVFESLTLVREGEVITVSSSNGAASWFPQGARVGKHPEANEAFMSNFCERKTRIPFGAMTPNPPIERTAFSVLRTLPAAAHLNRYAPTRPMR
ncbi:hypothetical protein [Halomonas kalidii]|uniref:Uncharacterized protein n=1 Tax=Halomonas kalidii TaxID=3043293 RepID=A0ABT6VL28_9GAMM|nr:hypothetical protein [Halomonas kalidii]MDI5934676.1 hypothetical protein [Halomonas kalidii]